MSTDDRERLIEAMLTRYRQLLHERLVNEPQTLDEIEQTVEEIGQELEHELEQRLLQRRKPKKSPDDNRALCPRCGSVARYRATEERRLITRHGEHSLARRRYFCPRCQKGFVPLDRALGLDRSATTVQVRLWVAQLAPRVAIGEGNGLLQCLTGVRLGASTFERIALHVGTRLRQAERAAATQHHAGHPPQVQRKPKRLYVSVDGIFAPLRDTWKKDGSLGALHCRWGECKTAVVYEAKAGKRGDEGVRWRAYTATFEKAAVFTPLVATLAHRAGHHFAHEVVFLADGQAYNWAIAASQFPTAIEIVDFQHAVSHLFGVAKGCFGEGSAAVQPWVDARKEELLQDEVMAVCRALAQLDCRTQEQRTLRTREMGYFRSNAQRMR